MVGLHKQLSVAQTLHEKAALQRQIDASDRTTCPDAGRIDQISSGTETRRYELYRLMDAEIRIVDEATHA